MPIENKITTSTNGCKAYSHRGTASPLHTSALPDTPTVRCDCNTRLKSSNTEQAAQKPSSPTITDTTRPKVKKAKVHRQCDAQLVSLREGITNDPSGRASCGQRMLPSGQQHQSASGRDDQPANTADKLTAGMTSVQLGRHTEGSELVAVEALLLPSSTLVCCSGR